MIEYLSLWRGVIRRHPTMREIATNILATWPMDGEPITIDDLRNPMRDRRLSWPRQAISAACLAAGHGPASVGRFMCRDHTTIIYGARRHNERVAAMIEGMVA